MGSVKPGYGPMPRPSKSTKRSRARAAKRAEQWERLSGPVQARQGTSGASHGQATDRPRVNDLNTRGVVPFRWEDSRESYREGAGHRHHALVTKAPLRGYDGNTDFGPDTDHLAAR